MGRGGNIQQSLDIAIEGELHIPVCTTLESTNDYARRKPDL
jgi:hypothetical protein